MATRKNPAKTETVAEKPESMQSVDQIRDILFGPQIRELEKSIVRIEERLTKLDEQMRTTRKDLRKLVLDQGKNLSDEIHANHESLSSTVDSEVAALRADKADRESLAALFAEMALRIKGEPLLPGSE